jgi:hypothetical protein
MNTLTLNRFRLLLVTIVLPAMGFYGCQKEGAQPAKTSSGLTKADLTVGPVPAITWWSSPPAIAYTDNIPGDKPIRNEYVHGFAINGKGFALGTLLTNAQWGLNTSCSDLWQWDPATIAWSKKSPFPGNPYNLEFGASFVIGDNAYVITIDNYVYQYNQPGDVWTKKSPVPGGIHRGNPYCFAISGLGYLGMGFNDNTSTEENLNDWWQYDPVADHWTSLHTFPGEKRNGGGSFAIDGKGYIVGGFGNSGYGVGVWQYDPGTDHWTQKNNFPGTSQYMPTSATGTIDGVDVGFIAAGQAWEYNPANDAWGQLTQYPGAQLAPGGFVVGNSFFICSIDVVAYNWSK